MNINSIRVEIRFGLELRFGCYAMKISLKLLLGIMLLAALAVNGFNNFKTCNVVQVKCGGLNAAIAKLKKQNQFFQERKLVYQRAFDGFELRKKKLLKAPEFFEPVARLHKEMVVQDSDSIRVMTIGGPSHENFAHLRFRIWLPDSPKFELCLGYHKTEFKGDSSLAVPDLTDSRFFTPYRAFSIILNAGETLVEFQVPYEIKAKTATKHQVQTRVNGSLVHEAQRIAVLPFWRMKQRRNWPELLVISASEDLVFDVKPLRLVTVNAWPDEEEPKASESVSLILRPIVEESSNE